MKETSILWYRYLLDRVYGDDQAELIRWMGHVEGQGSLFEYRHNELVVLAIKDRGFLEAEVAIAPGSRFYLLYDVLTAAGRSMPKWSSYEDMLNFIRDGEGEIVGTLRSRIADVEAVTDARVAELRS